MYSAKVVFLDIDGVLNSDRSIAARPMVEISDNYRINYLISKVDPIAVALLNSITEEANAKIVVSSANRIALPFKELANTLTQMGVSGEIIGITPILSKMRGDEIDGWIENFEKNFSLESYVILDDSDDFHPHHQEHFVHVDAAVGLSWKNTIDAKKLLGVNVSSLILL